MACTALAWAAGRGHTDIVHALLERGAKTEIGDKFGTTPLIWASRAGHTNTGQPIVGRDLSTYRPANSRAGFTKIGQQIVGRDLSTKASSQ